MSTRTPDLSREPDEEGQPHRGPGPASPTFIVVEVPWEEGQSHFTDEEPRPEGTAPKCRAGSALPSGGRQVGPPQQTPKHQGLSPEGASSWGPDSVMSERDTRGAGYPQVHRHRPRQHRVLVHLIQVLEPQQDTAEVCLGLALSVLGTEGRWHEDTVSAWHFTLSPPFHIFTLPRRQLTQPHFADEPNKAQRGAGTCPDTQLVCIKEGGGLQPRGSQSYCLPPPALRPVLKCGKSSFLFTREVLIRPVPPASCSLEDSLPWPL